MGIDRRFFLKGAGALALATLIPVPKFSNALASQGGQKTLNLVAGLEDINLGNGPSFQAWTYNGAVPGPVIRARLGDTLRINLINNLPEASTIHWHGLPVPNAMDGVPGLTQKPVPPGGKFVYEFPAEVSGTYIYHSHQSLQLDRGLYGALVIE